MDTDPTTSVSTSDALDLNQNPTPNNYSLLSSSYPSYINESLHRTANLFSPSAFHTSQHSIKSSLFLPSQALKIAVKRNREYIVETDREEERKSEISGLQGQEEGQDSSLLERKGQISEAELQLQLSSTSTIPKHKEKQTASSTSTSLIIHKDPSTANNTTNSNAKVGSIFKDKDDAELHLHNLRKEVKQKSKIPKPTWHAPWKVNSVLASHLGYVRCIDFDVVDNDKQILITGSADRTIKIWDFAKANLGMKDALRLTYTGHTGGVRDVKVSPHHRYLFSASEDHTIKCWDLERNQVCRTYHGHLSAVHTLSLHPSQGVDVLVSGGGDAVGRVWDMRSRTNVMVLRGHNNAIGTVVTNPIEPQVITGSHDKTIRLWDLVADKCMQTLTNHKKSIRSICMHPTQFSFFSGAADNIKSWQARDGTFLRNFSGHRAVINSVCCNEDGVFVSASDTGSMYMWDLNTGYNFQQIETVAQPGSSKEDNGIMAAKFDLTGTKLVTAEMDKSIKIWVQDKSATEESHPIDMEAWKEKCLARKKF